MALSGSIDLEEWWSMMTRLYELISAVVHRSHGWVGAFTGDGTNAVFEARRGTDEHAQRACRAALSLRDEMRAPAADLRRERQLELSVRIGINSGELLTGTVGGGYRRSQTICGYTVASTSPRTPRRSSGRSSSYGIWAGSTSKAPPRLSGSTTCWAGGPTGPTNTATIELVRAAGSDGDRAADVDVARMMGAWRWLSAASRKFRPRQAASASWPSWRAAIRSSHSSSFSRVKFHPNGSAISL